MATNKKKSKKASILSKLYRSKVILFVGIFGLVGATVIVATHAESNTTPLYQYVYNTAGVHHSIGFKQNYTLTYNGSTLGTRTVWQVNGGTHTNGHYMWYGPYASVSVPSPYNGIKACWDVVPPLQDHATVTLSVTYNSGASTLYSKSTYIANDPENGIEPGEGGKHNLTTYCADVHMAIGLYKNLEIRALPTYINPGNDVFLGDAFAIYKTTWQLY